MTTMTKSQIEIAGTCKILHLSKLRVSPFNARVQEQEPVTAEKFEELCESIRANGLIEPIVVRPTGTEFEVVAGTRRFAALKHIGQISVPTIVKEMDDNDVRIASLVENIHRNDLTEDEKEETLKSIYLETWDEWKPQDWAKWRCEYDEDKLGFAKQYLNRMQNERSGKIKRESTLEKSKSPTKPQTVFPTDKFRELASRIGYKPGSQYNALKGIGAYNCDVDYINEMPPTYKEWLEELAREKKLKEEEKQELAKRVQHQRKRGKGEPKTQKAKAKKTADKFLEELEKEKEKEKKKQERKTEKKKALPKKPSAAEIEKSTKRLREDITNVGINLFKLLTAQNLDINDPSISQMHANSIMATDRMNQLASFYSSKSVIALQQNIIIPLSTAVEKYRDILYETAESEKRKEDLGGR